MSTSCDLFVIGAGPGGYVTAIKAAQSGLSVIIADKRGNAGGTCLNVGCIPSKAWLNSSYKYYEALNTLPKHGITADSIKVDVTKMLDRKNRVVSDLTKGIDYLFKKNKVTFMVGRATITGQNEVSINDKKIAAKNILIATGSDIFSIPGIDIDEDSILSSTGALDLDRAPEHLCVVGGGYIGLEMGSVWKRLGSKVTVVEASDSITPNMDKDLRTALKKSLTKLGIDFKLSSQVKGIDKNPDGTLTVNLSDGSFTCDKVLMSIGRKPYTDGLGLENVGIETDQRGFISVNDHCQTKVPSIFAIGDAIGGMMLAHKAEEEGVMVAEFLSGSKGAHVNYHVIPAVIYTHPEVASVGFSEDQLKAENIDYNMGKFPFAANSRSKANGDEEGFVKILSHKETDKVLGVHIIGEMAGTMIAEAALAMEFGASAEDIARTCHAHPTHSEAMKEAALATFSKAIHF